MKRKILLTIFILQIIVLIAVAHSFNYGRGPFGCGNFSGGCSTTTTTVPPSFGGFSQIEPIGIGAGGSINETYSVNLMQKYNSTIAGFLFLNQTSVKLFYYNRTSQIIELFVNLSLGNKYLDESIPLPKFSMSDLSKNTLNILKYIFKMEYINKHRLLTTVEIKGVRVYFILSTILILLLIYSKGKINILTGRVDELSEKLKKK